jgi:hypothetical protein
MPRILPDFVGSLPCALVFNAPARDVGVESLTAFLTVGPEAYDVIVAFLEPRRDVNIRVPPRVTGNAPLLQVPALPVLPCFFPHGGLFHQGLQALLRGGIEAVVSRFLICTFASVTRASSVLPMSLGTTTAARRLRMKTTMMISMSVKPSCLRLFLFIISVLYGFVKISSG